MKFYSNYKTFLIIAIALGFSCYLMLALVNIYINVLMIFNSPIILFTVIKSVAYHYGLVFLIPLLTIKRIQKLSVFSYRILVLPILMVCAFAIYSWFSFGIDKTFYIGANWSNLAVLTWSSLFLLLLYFYEKHGASLVDGFVGAFASVNFGSWFFELLDPRIELSTYFFQPTIYASLGVFAFMIFKYKIQVNWKFLVLPFFCLLLQLPNFLHSESFALDLFLRLSTFPMFIYLPLKIRSKVS